MLTSIATSSARSACGCLRKARCSTRTSESICSLAVVTDVYSPSAIENAPASRPATPLITTVCAPAAAHTRDQRGVADQAVHRAERRRAQPAAADVGVPVIELVRQPGSGVAALDCDSVMHRFNLRWFAGSHSGLPTFATSQFAHPPAGYRRV